MRKPVPTRRFIHVPVALVVLAGASLVLGQQRAPTPDVGAGPNHKSGAPFRAKLSPPWAEGEALLVRGQVVDAGSGEGIPGAVLDAFHADHTGKYDTEGFLYRGRILTDETGRYEFETIVPSNYGPPPHIHFIVTHDGFKTLRTEMLFRDGAHPTNNHPELTPELTERSRNGKTWLEGEFDIALEPL